jgi:hypothetical protein
MLARPVVLSDCAPSHIDWTMAVTRAGAVSYDFAHRGGAGILETHGTLAGRT